ncbi:hypothetical protein HJC23_012726 [Cyclotella cryptica]|uniref:J domain-containing protein n=1 Tax=Cyclotella cryptica TaxID=29204 RepID=A0ABD3NUH3_9STRA|eukprot:CCRYP_019638-RA/>CCRYP_019638-RA protein AED:0.02 eAED:0.02 QI:253/1/1/1/1/1/2/608/718
MKSLLGVVLALHVHLTTPIKFNFHHQHSPSIDPYATLSVPPTATPTQIQKAYRLKARETHPDKNSSPNAHEEFRLISEAFEILSDPRKKNAYDQRRRWEERAKEEQRKREERRRRAEEEERKRAFIRKQEMIRKAQAGYDRVVKWSKLSQFEEMALDTSHGVYATNVLIMFVGNKAAEKKGEEDYYFPYPFVGESGAVINKDVLLIAKVRYNSPTPLTRRFRVPSKIDRPYFIFAKKGDPLHHYYIFHPRHSHVDPHEEWKQWVQSLLVIRGTVVNYHSLPVTVFILRHGKIEYTHESLNPNYEIELNFHPGDRIFAFDARVDNYPGGHLYNYDKVIQRAESIAILDTVVTADKEHIIRNKRCYDLSSQCYEWASTPRGQQSQCEHYPEFMHHICAYTCGVCREGILSDLAYALFHYPDNKLPPVLTEVVRSFRVFCAGLKDIVDSRSYSVVVLLVLGLLVAFNIVFFQSAMKSSSSVVVSGESESMMDVAWDVLVIVLVTGICITLNLFMSTPSYYVPMWLRSFHADINRVSRESDAYIVLLIAGIIGSGYVGVFSTFIKKESIEGIDIAVLIAVAMLAIGSLLGYTYFIIGNSTTSIIRWSHIWTYRKNAAVALMFVGTLIGTGLSSFKRRLEPLLKLENLPVLLIPNTFVIGGVICLSAMDRQFYSDLIHVVSSNKSASFAFVFLGMLGGLLYLKIIDKLTGDEVTKEVKKLKVD